MLLSPVHQLRSPGRTPRIVYSSRMLLLSPPMGPALNSRELVRRTPPNVLLYGRGGETWRSVL